LSYIVDSYFVLPMLAVFVTFLNIVCSNGHGLNPQQLTWSPKDTH